MKVIIYDMFHNIKGGYNVRKIYFETLKILEDK